MDVSSYSIKHCVAVDKVSVQRRAKSLLIFGTAAPFYLKTIANLMGLNFSVSLSPN